MSRLGAAFARLSKRERVLVSVMAGMVLFLIIFLVNLWLSSGVNALEERVKKEQELLLQIYGSASDYQVAQAAFDRARKQSEENAELNLTNAVAMLADTISFESVDARNNPTGKKKLKDYLDFGSPKDTRLSRKRGRQKKADPLAGYFRRDLDVSVRDNCTFDALYKLMEKLEKSDQMLFITEMRLERHKRNPDRVGRSKIVVATFYYDGKKEE